MISKHIIKGEIDLMVFISESIKIRNSPALNILKILNNLKARSAVYEPEEELKETSIIDKITVIQSKMLYLSSINL